VVSFCIPFGSHFLPIFLEGVEVTGGGSSVFGVSSFCIAFGSHFLPIFLEGVEVAGGGSSVFEGAADGGLEFPDR